MAGQTILSPLTPRRKCVGLVYARCAPGIKRQGFARANRTWRPSSAPACTGGTRYPAAEVDKKGTVPDAQCRSVHSRERNGKAKKAKRGKKESQNRRKRKIGPDGTENKKKKERKKESGATFSGVGIPAKRPQLIKPV